MREKQENKEISINKENIFHKKKKKLKLKSYNNDICK